MRAANLGLRFLLELGALAAVGYWGWKTGDGLLGWALAIAAISAVIAVWALFVSPKHTVETSKPVSFAIELAVWLAAGAGLYTTGHEALGLAFAGVSMASGALNYAWR
jgi:Na+/melibiose symporter-like transporter